MVGEERVVHISEEELIKLLDAHNGNVKGVDLPPFTTVQLAASITDISKNLAVLTALFSDSKTRIETNTEALWGKPGTDGVVATVNNLSRDLKQLTGILSKAIWVVVTPIVLIIVYCLAWLISNHPIPGITR